MKSFDPKLSASVELFAFDFARELASGEIITSASWTVSTLAGVDASASSMQSGQPAIAGTRVSQLIANGASGVRYLVECIAVTNFGQQIPAYASLYVTDPS